MRQHTGPLMLIASIVLTTAASFAQNDSIGRFSSSKGEFYILNWMPSASQNGPILSQTTLNYDYGIVNEELAQQFNFQYYLGNFFIYKGKKYTVEEIGEKLFKEITVRNITFKAKVFSEDEYITDILIEYPDIIAKSGGESGWYSVKGLEWDEVFVGIAEKKTRKMFESGFELKDSEIYYINFEGVDTIISLLEKRLEKAKKEKASVTQEFTAYTGSSDGSDGNGGKRRVKFSETNFAHFIFDYEKGGSRAKNKGVPWRLNIYTGLKYSRFPINVNGTNQITIDQQTEVEYQSFRDVGGGYSLDVGLSYWPFFGKYFGLGTFGRVSAGGIPRLYLSSYTLYGGDFGFLTFFGDRKAKLVLEYSNRYRYGIYFEQENTILLDSKIYSVAMGIAEFTTSRIGMGTKLWITNPTLRTLDMNLYFDFLNLPYTNNTWVMTLGMKYWKPAKFSVSVELTPFHPIIGEVFYAPVANNASGAYFVLKVVKEFDVFGRPHFLAMNRGKRIWK